MVENTVLCRGIGEILVAGHAQTAGLQDVGWTCIEAAPHFDVQTVLLDEIKDPIPFPQVVLTRLSVDVVPRAPRGAGRSR